MLGTWKACLKRKPEWVEGWESTAHAKVALKTDDEASLLQLAAAAKEAGLPLYLVTDAGRTQIAAGSRTVLGIGPGTYGRGSLCWWVGFCRVHG